LGIYDIPKEQQKYDLYVPLHRLWVGYVREILNLKDGEQGFVTAASAGSILASADFHGAELEVVRSRCVGRVGCKGIVVKDTKFTFEFVTKGNTLKVVPKEHSIFRFEVPQHSERSGEAQKAQIPQGVDIAVDSAVLDVPPLVFELHGSQFANRATDRATKKFKQRRMDHL